MVRWIPPSPHARKPQLGYNTDAGRGVPRARPPRLRRHAARRRRAADRPSSIRLPRSRCRRAATRTAHVDAALERLEDAFAAQERQVAARLHGDEAWLAEARTTAQVVSNRLARPEGHRFDRMSFLTLGYNVREVDRFADKLTRYFRDGWPIRSTTCARWCSRRSAAATARPRSTSCSTRSSTSCSPFADLPRRRSRRPRGVGLGSTNRG